MKPRKWMVENRICGVCKGKVPEGTGTYNAWLHLLFHHGKCSETALGLCRDYSKSKRGRWRKLSDIYGSLGLFKYLGWL